jgi:(2Fe-2S) ferredoxin
MKNLRHHFFVCTNERPAGMKQPCGGRADSSARQVFQALVDAVNRHMLWYEVLVSSSGCLGPCGAGPTIVVYPEGTWYGAVRLEDVGEIVAEHMLRGKPVERLVYRWPEELQLLREAREDSGQACGCP